MTEKDEGGADEAILVRRLLARDEAAFREVVQRLQGPMWQLARSIVGEAIADEVVQEAWVSVMKSLDRFEGRSSLKTWVLRIVGNGAKSRLRRESRNVAAGDAEESYEYAMDQRFAADGHWRDPPRRWNDAASPEDILAAEELRGRVQDAIDALPAMQQAVLALRDQQGLGMDAICKILDISESNSRVLLHRARQRVWRAIESYETEQS